MATHYSFMKPDPRERSGHFWLLAGFSLLLLLFFHLPWLEPGKTDMQGVYSPRQKLTGPFVAPTLYFLARKQAELSRQAKPGVSGGANMNPGNPQPPGSPPVLKTDQARWLFLLFLPPVLSLLSLALTSLSSGRRLATRILPGGPPGLLALQGLAYVLVSGWFGWIIAPGLSQIGLYGAVGAWITSLTGLLALAFGLASRWWPARPTGPT